MALSCPSEGTVGGKISASNQGADTRTAFGPTCLVSTPSPCHIQAEITTGTLNFEATDLAGAEPLYFRFTPAIQPFTVLMVSNCAAEGLLKVQGQTNCQVVAPTVSAVTKSCVFNEGGKLFGSLRLSPGSGPVSLSGTVGFTLSGANTGKPWSANL
jgi:hypothetical protein